MPFIFIWGRTTHTTWITFIPSSITVSVFLYVLYALRLTYCFQHSLLPQQSTCSIIGIFFLQNRYRLFGFHIYMRSYNSWVFFFFFSVYDPIEPERRMVVARGWGLREGEMLIKGYRLSVIKRFLQVLGI